MESRVLSWTGSLKSDVALVVPGRVLFKLADAGHPSDLEVLRSTRSPLNWVRMRILVSAAKILFWNINSFTLRLYFHTECLDCISG